MAFKLSNTTAFIARITLLTSLAALSIDSMLPALPAIGESLGVTNDNHLQYIILFFVLGMSFGELLFGPLSDSLGRKKALVVGVTIYCFGTVIAMLSPTLELHLAGRMIQGFGVSGPKIISRAMIRDLYEGNRMAQVLSFIMTIFIFIPMMAPILGAFILSITSWRAIFLVFLLIAVIATMWVLVKQPETLPPSKRKQMQLKPLLKTTLNILQNPLVLCYSVIAGLAFGVFLTFLSTSQAMFEQIYDKADSFPYYWALLGSGFGIATLLNGKLVMKYGMYRLSLGGITGLILLGIFFTFGGSVAHSFPSFLFGCYILMFSIGFIFSNLSALAMQPLHEAAGLGAALISTITTLIAVVVSVVVGYFYNNTLYPLSFAILVNGILALCLLGLAHVYKNNPAKLIVDDSCV